MKSSRRRDTQEELGLTTLKEEKDMNKSISKEIERQERKMLKQIDLEYSTSYKLIYYLKKYMDDYFLDPILGFFVPVIGDILPSLLVAPYIYVSLFKIRSIPLTLAIIYNMLLDWLIGMIPMYIGDVIDVFNKAYKKNWKLIVGFVEDDEETIQEVNKKAIFMGIMIFILSLLIYWVYQLLAYIYEGIASLF